MGQPLKIIVIFNMCIYPLGLEVAGYVIKTLFSYF